MSQHRWPFDTQSVRGSLEHVGKDGSANHFHAVLDASASNIESRTHKNAQPHNLTSHTKHRSAKKEHCGWKNDRLLDSKTKAKLVAHILAIQLGKKFNTHAHERWSFPLLQNLRESRNIVTTHANAVPTSKETNIESCTHYNRNRRTSRS